MFNILIRNRRGVGSIIGAVFLLLILLTGYVYYALQVNATYNYNKTLLEMQELALKRSKENIKILEVTFDAGNLNITVENTGSYLAHLIWLGIFDEINNAQDYYKIDFYVDPAETVTNVGNNTISSFKNDTRTIQIVTELGNIFSCSYPISFSEKEGEYDFVDALGSLPIIGTHSFFSAMQSGPDGIMDILTEGGTTGVSQEDYVDVFPSGIGTHTNQTAQQDAPNGVYDTLTEAVSPAIQYYYPSGYNLVGGTTYDSGLLSDLTSDNSIYMSFKSYMSASFATTLYAHQETTNIGGTAYYNLLPSSADTSGLLLSASMGSSRTVLGKFVYSLQGVSSIPASTWAMYYRAWKDADLSIIYDAASSYTYTGGSSSFSWTHTTGIGNNRLLVVTVSTYRSAGTTPPVTVSQVTYGAVAMTQQVTNVYTSTTYPQVRSYIFYLLNPASGSNTVSVTMSGSSYAVGGAVSYAGVDQTTPIQTQNTAIGRGSSQSVSVTVTGNGRVVYGSLAGYRTSTYTITDNSGQNHRWGQTSSNYKGHGDDKLNVSPGSVSIGWTTSSSGVSYVCCAIAINPVTPAVGHVDLDINIRKSDNSIRQNIATNVAASGSLTTSASTLSGTYSWPGYVVVDQTDYLELDFYLDVSTICQGTNAYLRIDDMSLATNDQTRATNILQPSEYTVEVEFAGSSDVQSWSQMVWTVDSQFTAPSVTTTLQLWNYHTGNYSTNGDGYLSYTSSSTQGTDETRTQIITSNPIYFRDSSGNWKLKIKGVKITNSQFSWKGDFIQYQDQYPVYQLNLEEQFTNCDYSQTNGELCIYTRGLSSENLMVDIWSNSTLAWITVISSLQPDTWNNVTVTSYLTSETLRIRFWTGIEIGDTTQDSWQIDSTLLQFRSSSNYRLDLEVQWTNVDHNERYGWLCIYGGNMSEREYLRVDVWNGTLWVTIIPQLKSGWNSINVSSYLVSSTFKIRFRDTQETNDIYQDSWDIDVTMLHVWT